MGAAGVRHPTPPYRFINIFFSHCCSPFFFFFFCNNPSCRKLGSRVKTTCVCPYYVNTGMFSGVRTRFPFLLPILEPEYVVGKIMAAIEADTAVLVTPRLLYTVPVMRALPTRVFDWIAEILGISASMDEFKGRGDAFYKRKGQGAESPAKRKKSQ
jgi:hypothetical protein